MVRCARIYYPVREHFPSFCIVVRLVVFAVNSYDMTQQILHKIYSIDLTLLFAVCCCFAAAAEAVVVLIVVDLFSKTDIHT